MKRTLSNHLGGFLRAVSAAGGFAGAAVGICLGVASGVAEGAFERSEAWAYDVGSDPSPTLGEEARRIPPCLNEDKEPMEINNDAIIHWKKTTRNQFLARARASGKVGKIYDDRNGHDHFQIILDPVRNVQPEGTAESLEIIYNHSFGDLPKLQPGQSVEACGDYITSNRPTSNYPASPDDAILHWVHFNPSGRGHSSGYVMVDGVVYGDRLPHAKEHHKTKPGSKRKPRRGQPFDIREFYDLFALSL